MSSLLFLDADTVTPPPDPGEAATAISKPAPIVAAVDAFVDETRPGQNFGTNARLRLNGGASNNNRQVFIYFPLPTSLIGARIVSANLRVYMAGTWSGETISVRRVTSRWREGLITWNNLPENTTVGEVTSSALTGVAGQEIMIPIPGLVQAFANGGKWHGVRLLLSADVHRTLYSSDSAEAFRYPTLELEYSFAPRPPSDLAPDHETAWHTAFPIYRWTFRDRWGNTEQAHSQVQVSSSTSFATTVYDSGKQPNTLSSWDMNIAEQGNQAYSVPDGSTRYWRVRVWDASDLSSEWSETASFVRSGKGTVNITNPSGATVEDLTPPITWTFSGTQESYSVLLFHIQANDGKEYLVAEQPRVVSTALTWTPPEGVIQSGEQYKVYVRVWDNIDRDDAPGFKAYAEDSQQFSYVRNGTGLTGVSNLTAVVEGASVVLEWTRASAPDFFSLRRDGKEVVPRIDPGDVLISGTTYRLRYWGVTPRKATTLEVEAVVNSSGVLRHSGGNPTVSVTTTPIGIWLADERDGTAVFIAGDDDADLALGESGTTHALIGRRKMVRIVDSIRGYEGAVSGTLLTRADRDLFMTLKGRLAPKMRLILADLNLPVEVEDATLAPDPITDGIYGVTFNVFQSGEFPLAEGV